MNSQKFHSPYQSSQNKRFNESPNKQDSMNEEQKIADLETQLAIIYKKQMKKLNFSDRKKQKECGNPYYTQYNENFYDPLNFDPDSRFPSITTKNKGKTQFVSRYKRDYLNVSGEAKPSTPGYPKQNSDLDINITKIKNQRRKSCYCQCCGIQTKKELWANHIQEEVIQGEGKPKKKKNFRTIVLRTSLFNFKKKEFDIKTLGLNTNFVVPEIKNVEIVEPVVVVQQLQTSKQTKKSPLKTWQIPVKKNLFDCNNLNKLILRANHFVNSDKKARLKSEDLRFQQETKINPSQEKVVVRRKKAKSQYKFKLNETFKIQSNITQPYKKFNEQFKIQQMALLPYIQKKLIN